MLLGLVVFASVSLGYLLGHQRSTSEIILVPASYVSQESSAGLGADVAVTQPNTSVEVGRLKAEILRLQALFLRLAEVAGLDDGEFDLDSEPLSSRAPDSPDTLALVKLDLDHISKQSKWMQRIYRERVSRHQLRISGKPINNRAISSRFGFRVDPNTGQSRLHRGIDFAGKIGEPILAIASGIVTYAGDNGGYGNLVELEHANGYRTRYAHNDEVLVDLGAVVKKGQQIATLGSTGRSTGPHLHFEVRQHGKAMDPQHFIR